MPPKRRASKKPRSKTSDRELDLECSSKRSKTAPEENKSQIITRFRRKRPHRSTTSSVVSEPFSSQESISTQDSSKYEEKHSQGVLRVPSNDQFAEVLSREPDWYTLGVFLGATTQELDTIGINYRGVSLMRCLIELYKHLENREKLPSWKFLAECLRRMGNVKLANKIDSDYITLRPLPFNKERATMSAFEHPDFTDVDEVPPPDIADEYEKLRDEFNTINLNIKRAFVKSRKVDVDDLQHVIKQLCFLEVLPKESRKETIAKVLRRLEENISFLDRQNKLKSLVRKFLPENWLLLAEMTEFEMSVQGFKTRAKIKHLIGCAELVKYNTSHKVMKLKSRKFWGNATIAEFEKATNVLLPIEYRHCSPMSVESGCFIFSWIIPKAFISDALPKHSLEFIKIIGVMSLHIGEDVIYDFTIEPGCEVLEAAMMQAIELRNKQAIEFLLAMGCSPEVATYNGGNAVTTIVNIREQSSASDNSAHHVCVLGQNEHVEAIVDPSHEPQCSSRGMKDTMIEQIHHSPNYYLEKKDEEVKSKESDSSKSEDAHCDYEELLLVEKLKERDQEIEMLRKVAKFKYAENDRLVKENQTLIKESMERGFVKTQTKMYENLWLDNQQLRMNIPTFHSHTGRYCIQYNSVDEQQAHILSIKINNQKMVANIEMVPSPLNKEKWIVAVNRLNRPFHIDTHNEYIVVTEYYGQCVSVFNKEGVYIRTFGSKGDKPGEFHGPSGIALTDDNHIVVVDKNNCRIQKFTIEGKFVEAVGSQGKGPLQFSIFSCGLSIHPRTGKIYICDTDNHRIQVINPDFTFSHEFGSFGNAKEQFHRPHDIAFDENLVYVVDKQNLCVKVFTMQGDYHSEFGDFKGAEGIAVDIKKGVVYVSDSLKHTISLFKTASLLKTDSNNSSIQTLGHGMAVGHGNHITKIGTFSSPAGLAVDNEGALYVCDRANYRLQIL